MYLYPQDDSVAPFGLTAHGVFLVALTALSLASLARWRTVDRLVGRHPASAFAVACLGSAGAALVLFHQEGPLPSGLVWASAVLVASGFLVLLLGWARYLSEGFGTRLLLVLTASYLLSLIVFKNSWLARTGDVAGLVAIALIPAGSGLGLLLAGTLKRTGLNGGGDSADLRFLFAPPIGLFIAFLLAGSAVRGMVDAVAARHRCPGCRLPGLCNLRAQASARRRERREALHDAPVRARLLGGLFGDVSLGHRFPRPRQRKHGG